MSAKAPTTTAVPITAVPAKAVPPTSDGDAATSEVPLKRAKANAKTLNPKALQALAHAHDSDSALVSEQALRDAAGGQPLRPYARGKRKQRRRDRGRHQRQADKDNASRRGPLIRDSVDLSVEDVHRTEKPLTVLVYGGRGWIGSMVVQQLKAAGHKVISPHTRADNVEAVRDDLHTFEPDRVLCVLGRTHGLVASQLQPQSSAPSAASAPSAPSAPSASPSAGPTTGASNPVGTPVGTPAGTDVSTIDCLEQPGALRFNLRDNLFAPLALALECGMRNIHFTYVGTGCIFHYDEAHPLGVPHTGFTENDTPNFFGSSYSVVKGYTDRLFSMPPFANAVLNLRIRMPIDERPHPRNFVTKIAGYERVVDIPNSVTVLPTLLPCLVDLVERGVAGTLNFTNPGAISHNQVLKLYQKHVDPDFVIRNFSVAEQARVLKAGRSNNTLETERLEDLFPVGSVLNAHEAVDLALRRYAVYARRSTEEPEDPRAQPSS